MNRFFETERVGLAGDWHGNTLWAMSAINLFFANDIKVIYQLGDFGIWGGEGGTKYLRKLNKMLVKNDQLLIVTPGNHENYNMIRKWPLNEWGFQNRADLTNIWTIPRGKIWEHNGVMVGSMGGAASVDLEHRTINKSWWLQEAITEKDIAALRESMKDYGYGIDVLLTHDVPVEAKAGLSKWPLSEYLEYYSYQQQVKISEAVEICNPTWLFHGHWHTSRVKEVDLGWKKMTVVGYGMDGQFSNLGWADFSPKNGVSNVHIMRSNTEAVKVD
jgi:hypothetical protein